MKTKDIQDEGSVCHSEERRGHQNLLETLTRDQKRTAMNNSQTKGRRDMQKRRKGEEKVELNITILFQVFNAIIYEHIIIRVGVFCIIRQLGSYKRCEGG